MGFFGFRGGFGERLCSIVVLQEDCSVNSNANYICQ